MPDDVDGPATKLDLNLLRQDLDLLRQELTTHIDQRAQELVEQMRDMQTEVLRAFHNWASPVDVKLRSHEERLMLLEERVTEMERGRGSRSLTS